MNSTEFIDFADADIEYTGAGDPIFLAKADEEGWRCLFEHCVRFPFQAGEEIIRKGDLGQSLFIITEGELETISPDKNSPEGVRLALMPTTTVFGEQAFFDGQPRSATIRAMTNGELLELTMENFQKLSERNPRLASMILFDLGRIISLRLRATTKAFIDTI